LINHRIVVVGLGISENNQKNTVSAAAGANNALSRIKSGAAAPRAK